MIWFVMVSPAVFFVVMSISLLMEVGVVILDAMDDDDEINWERVQAYKDRIEAQDAGLPLETYIFLRKAAELRQP